MQITYPRAWGGLVQSEETFITSAKAMRTVFTYENQDLTRLVTSDHTFCKKRLVNVGEMKSTPAV